MPSNQELNELVARKLGWERISDSHWFKNGHKTRRNSADYCGSIQAAWEIVEYLIESKILLELKAFSDGGIAWGIEISTLFGERIYPPNKAPITTEYVSDTAPLAICKAFLALP